MFNNYFFEDSGQDSAFKFLKEGGNNTVIMTDPPFGGMVDALAASFLKLSSIFSKKNSELNQDQENSSATGIFSCISF